MLVLAASSRPLLAASGRSSTVACMAPIVQMPSTLLSDSQAAAEVGVSLTDTFLDVLVYTLLAGVLALTVYSVAVTLGDWNDKAGGWVGSPEDSTVSRIARAYSSLIQPSTHPEPAIAADGHGGERSFQKGRNLRSSQGRVDVRGSRLHAHHMPAPTGSPCSHAVRYKKEEPKKPPSPVSPADVCTIDDSGRRMLHFGGVPMLELCSRRAHFERNSLHPLRERPANTTGMLLL